MKESLVIAFEYQTGGIGLMEIPQTFEAQRDFWKYREISTDQGEGRLLAGNETTFLYK